MTARTTEVWSCETRSALAEFVRAELIPAFCFPAGQGRGFLSPSPHGVRAR